MLVHDTGKGDAGESRAMWPVPAARPPCCCSASRHVTDMMQARAAATAGWKDARARGSEKDYHDWQKEKSGSSLTASNSSLLLTGFD